MTFFLFNVSPTTVIYTLSLHDALPIWNLHFRGCRRDLGSSAGWAGECVGGSTRSEEHTSELQSRLHIVCRLLLEKKNTLFPTAREIYGVDVDSKVPDEMRDDWRTLFSI